MMRNLINGLGAAALVMVSIAGAAAQDTPAGMSGDLLPPNAKPGECYARVFVPPQYSTETEEVQVKGPSARVEIVPARYEWVEEKVLVKEASEKLEIIPAQDKTVTEQVLVQEAGKKIETVPAQYEWVEEKMLVEPAHTVWKKGRGPIEKVDNGTGEIMCLVEVPAVYKTVKKRVEKEPAKTRTVDVPAEYKAIDKRVLAAPPTTRKVEIPAEYQTVKVRKMVQPPQERTVEIPAEYQTVTKTRKVAEGGLEWRPVLCETNMTSTTIRDLQVALQKAGYDPGPIDGIYGVRTRDAVRSFQQAKNLPAGSLTIETLKALDVTL